jgi:hypothetical protein
MARPSPRLALVVSALALAGCGSSGAGQGTTATAGSTGSSPAALAQAIGLRAGDAPGFKIDTRTSSGADSSQLASGACAVQGTGALASASSQTLRSQPAGPPDHGGPLYTLSSLVLVDGEATEAETQLFAAIGTAAKACLHDTRAAIANSRSPVASLTVAALPKPVPGLPIYGIKRSDCLGSTSSCAVAGSEDRYFFAVGRVLVAVQATSSSGAFPPALAQHLLALLYQRALAHTP